LSIEIRKYYGISQRIDELVQNSRELDYARMPVPKLAKTERESEENNRDVGVESEDQRETL